MSEEILKALMQMFAIIARVDDVGNGRQIVESFLRLQLNQAFVEQYLAIFDDFSATHHQATQKKDGAEKRNSLNSVKVLKICTQINLELTQEQKIVVLLRLIEFINSNPSISEQEFDFVNIVSDTFNIDHVEFVRCLTFIQAKEHSIPDSSKILVIDNKMFHDFQLTKHIFAEGISGQARILWLSSVNIFALMYFGHDDLYLNGQNLIQGKVYILTPGSSLRGLKIKPVYYSDILSAFMSDTIKTKISFVVQNLEYKFSNGKIGLREINFSESSGKLIGIMGSSGAGKSTLLNVLNSNEAPFSGSVKINGIDIHKEKNKIEGVIGMVSQDDLLIEELTVFQNLFYNTKLCFGNKSDEEISEIVVNVLTNLGLIATRDLKVGNPLEKIISGGQRKRLNIALELIREPSVLFVDEPTSGLSSRDSENIMDLLKELTLKGKLIFVVIHQPSSDIFKMFDNLMILDEGGYPIYYGNPVDSIIYFKTIVNQINSNESECIECGNVNPEQIFNIIEAKVLDEFGNITQTRKILPNEWNKYYKEKIEKKVFDNVDSIIKIPESTFKIPNKIKQFKVFITRDVLSKLTNKQYIFINLLEAPVLGFLLAYLVKYFNTDLSNKVGYIFRENSNLPAFIFMAVIVALFIGLIVSAEEIIRDRKIQKRESFLNLSWGSYIWSKITIMFFLSAIQTILFVMVANYVLEIKGMTGEYWLVLFTASCCANLMGLNISSSFNSVITIYILIPFLIIPQLLLSGVIVKFDKLNPNITSQSVVPIVGEIMTSRWAFEAIAVKQFKDNKFNKRFYKYDKGISIATYKKDYWLTDLSGKLDNCESEFKNPEKREEVIDALKMIKSEINKELKVRGNEKLKCDGLEKLNINLFTPEIANQIREFLSVLKTKYINDFNRYNNSKDAEISTLTKDSISQAKYLKEKNESENESLVELVTNKNSLLKILDLDGTYIQKSDPIYLDPINSNLGRAQFFAPQKKFLNKYYDTFGFNLCVIWLMSLVLVITLYFNIFKKIIDWIGNKF